MLLWRKISRLAQQSIDYLNMLMTQQHCWYQVTADVDLEDGFENVKQWAKDNIMILNF